MRFLLSIHLSFPLGVLTGLLLVLSGARGADRPNILLIYTDDQTHRSVGSYREFGAYPWVRTPHIDELARRGVLFSHAYIGTWCMPSRATLLTGHHPFGIESMRTTVPYPRSSYDPRLCPFWPRVFREQGYFTAQIGKWHTGIDAGFGRDWDYQIVWNRPKDTFNSPSYFHDQFVQKNGAPAVPVQGYSTDNYTKWTIDLLDQLNTPDAPPWFLWLCYDGPHAPFTPADRHLDAYEGVTVPVPVDIYTPHPFKPSYLFDSGVWRPGPHGQPVMPIFKSVNLRSRGIHGETLNHWVRQYHETVLSIDEGVGQIMAALRASGQLDNTLVIFTSDQGYAIGQHGFFTKLAPYDANLRAPLIFSLPGTIPQGEICRHPVGGVDLIPTMFSFAGIPLPWEMHGHDLSPLLFQPGRPEWPHGVLQCFTRNKFGSDTAVIPKRKWRQQAKGVPWWVSWTEGNYKYIRTLVSGEIEELYDLSRDPGEARNLAVEPAYQSRLRRMREGAIDELRRTRAPFVDAMPPYRTEIAP